jgi:hypothetical protein
MIIKIQTLLDFNAFTCFVDKELVQQHKLTLLKKITLVGVEVSDKPEFLFKTCDT